MLMMGRQMAKGQKKSGREAKKPKATKKPDTATSSQFSPPPRPPPAKGAK
jgi:hypothetical protein